MSAFQKLLSKPVCFFFLIAGLIIGNGIMFLFGNDPSKPLGTISILCEDRKYLFWIWAFFVVGGYFLNTLYAYRRYHETSKLLLFISVFAVIAACGIGLSLKHDVTTWNPKRIVHWVSTGVYMAALGLSIMIFLFKNAKRYHGFLFLGIVVLLILFGIAVWLLTLGKSGLMEMVPNTILEILLLLLNFILPVKPKNTSLSDTEIP